MARGGRTFSTAARALDGIRPAQHLGCKVGEVFTMLGQPHMLHLLDLFLANPDTPLRFMVIQAELRISPKTLTQRLRAMVDAGFLTRRSFNTIPPRVEYEITPKTRELAEVFRVLEEWSTRNTLKPVASVSVVGRVAPPVAAD